MKSGNNWRKAGVLEVGPQSQYKTIQAAVDAAIENSVIKICAGVYFENVDVTKDNLSFSPKGEQDEVIVIALSQPVFCVRIQDKSFCRIEQLKIVQNAYATNVFVF
jgi:pectin methylesterase-like acyl-CoA thioesterase